MALEDDVRDVLSVIVRKYPYMNFAQIDMRKNFVSIEDKLPSRDSDTDAPHFLVLHTHDSVEETNSRLQQGHIADSLPHQMLARLLLQL